MTVSAGEVCAENALLRDELDRLLRDEADRMRAATVDDARAEHAVAKHMRDVVRAVHEAVHVDEAVVVATQLEAVVVAVKALSDALLDAAGRRHRSHNEACVRLTKAAERVGACVGRPS